MNELRTKEQKTKEQRTKEQFPTLVLRSLLPKKKSFRFFQQLCSRTPTESHSVAMHPPVYVCDMLCVLPQDLYRTWVQGGLCSASWSCTRLKIDRMSRNRECCIAPLAPGLGPPSMVLAKKNLESNICRPMMLSSPSLSGAVLSCTLIPPTFSFMALLAGHALLPCRSHLSFPANLRKHSAKYREKNVVVVLVFLRG